MLLIALMLFATFAWSQEIRTLSANEGSQTTTFGGYGAPLIQFSQMNGDLAVIVGGKGGAVINRKFVFGGIGKAVVNNITFSGDDLEGNNDVLLRLGYGEIGVFLEYVFKLESPVHFSIPVNIMAGRASVHNDGSDVEVEASGVFVVEPGINLEFNVSENFMPGINVSYRQVWGSSLENISDQDLAGFNVGLLFKFGSF